MTIASTTNRASYSGNGVTTVFSFPYYFLEDSDLIVIQRDSTTGVETTKALTTDYTVSGAGVQAGGSVTMLVAPPTGTTLSIIRDPAGTQELDLVENDALPAESLEQSLDRLTMLVQRLQDKLDRSAILTEGYTESFDPTFPALIEGDKVLAFNPAGDGFALGPSISEISDAQANAVAAAASASAAAGSASSASSSASAASSSASAASASAAAAAASVASVMWKDVVFKDFADSPITLSASDRGKMYVIDTTSGNCVVNLTQISLLDLSTPFVLGVKKLDSSANTLTINAYNAGDGTDKVNGANSKVLSNPDSGTVLIPDTDTTPDSWTTADFGASSSSSGGGGGALRWIEGASAPLMSVDVDQEVYSYESGQSQDLFTNVRVPTGYVAGHQINMNMLFVSPDSSGNVLMRAQATLVRPGTDVITATTNQRTTTNSAVTQSGATQNKPQAISLDLTSSSGQINGVAVSPGDLIKVRFYRDTDTAGSNVKALPYNAEVTFS